MSYSVTGGGGGGQTAVATLPHHCSIPNTPDVINSIMSLMDPFQHFPGNGSLVSEDSSGSTCSPVSTCSSVSTCSPVSTCPPVSTCSPVSPTARMPSICSSLKIKEELKMAIRSKQKNAATATATVTSACISGSPVETIGPITSGACAMIVAATASTGLAASSPGGGYAKKRRIDEESHGDDDYDDDDGDDVSSHGEGLTAEDEERRRRRRERNKIAATKCRLKKREKTTNLMQESNVLETKNYDLKSQIQELETQRNELMKMLSAHPCARRHPHQHHQQQHHQHQSQHQHQQQLQEQYAVEPYATDPYRHQHGHVTVDPPILKDTMFNGGGYVPVPPVANQPADVYHRPATTTAAASMATVPYPIVGVGGGSSVYASCVDELYDYNKDLISGGGGGPPDLSHQYYDHGIC